MPARLENIVPLMSQIQSCSWANFKMNEIVNFEKCLQEASLEDPRVSRIVRKLVSECVFVEPKRKSMHLVRDEMDKRSDLELVKQTQIINEGIKKLDQEIDYYRGKLSDLLTHEQDTDMEISQLRKNTVITEDRCKASHKEFVLVLERVVTSFEDSISTIKVKIPEFVGAIVESNLVKHIGRLPSSYRRCIIELVKNGEHYQQPQHATQLSYHMKKAATSHMKEYLATITNLYSDLSLVDRIHSDEIPKELEYLKVLETHLDYLETPLERAAPKRIKVLYSDLTPMKQPVTRGAPPETVEDLDLNQLFSRLSATLRSFVTHNDD